MLTAPTMSPSSWMTAMSPTSVLVARGENPEAGVEIGRDAACRANASRRAPRGLVSRRTRESFGADVNAPAADAGASSEAGHGFVIVFEPVDGDVVPLSLLPHA